MWTVLSLVACREINSSLYKMIHQWEKMIRLMWLTFLSQQRCKTWTKCQKAITDPQRVIQRTNATSDHWWKMTAWQLFSERKTKHRNTRNTFFLTLEQLLTQYLSFRSILYPDCETSWPRESLTEKSVSVLLKECFSSFHCSKSTSSTLTSHNSHISRAVFP